MQMVQSVQLFERPEVMALSPVTFWSVPMKVVIIFCAEWLSMSVEKSCSIMGKCGDLSILSSYLNMSDSLM